MTPFCSVVFVLAVSELTMQQRQIAELQADLLCRF